MRGIDTVIELLVREEAGLQSKIKRLTRRHKTDSVIKPNRKNLRETQSRLADARKSRPADLPPQPTGLSPRRQRGSRART